LSSEPKNQQKSPILGYFMRLLKFSFIYMVRADIFIRFFGSFLIQNCGLDFPINFSEFWPSPPKAAKWVRTIFKIHSHRGFVKELEVASLRSATKS